MTLQARYTILRKIADGGTAEIFLATQHGAHGFEKTVVLKRIFPAFYADPQFRNMLVDEAHIAMTLNHSNIVQVLDLGEAGGQYVLAMDLVDGWTLDAVLRRSRTLNTGLPPALALYLTAEVCRALAYAHSKTGTDDKPLGIVHRDISPHNLLLSEQGEVKLTDFGIAKARNRRESSLGNMIKGKIAYMSPEQASGGPIDSRSDLFSVGTMLYVMVCWRYPFDAPTDLEMLLLVKQGDCVPPETARPGLNPEIYRVLHRAMSKEPGERYQRAEDMLIDVEKVMRVAFRAVGQTELKRWLQDLSMRDGVPPLTRAPAAPWTPAAGQGAHETLELKGVGATLPPPGPAAPTSHAAPPPRPQRFTPAPARTGLAGKLRPPPPAAAMAVGKATIKATPRSPEHGERAGAKTGGASPPGGRETPGAAFSTSHGPPHPGADPMVATPLPVLDEKTGPGSGPHRSVGSGPIPHTRDAEPAPTSGPIGRRGIPARGTETGAADADGSRTPATMFDGPPATPRKSSTWVAEAVAASAQRAGIAPPPPVGPFIPPPVPMPAPPTQNEPPAEPEPPPIPPRSRRLMAMVGLGVAAVVVIGISVKTCGGEPSGRGSPVVQKARPSAAPAASSPAPDHPAPVALVQTPPPPEATPPAAASAGTTPDDSAARPTIGAAEVADDAIGNPPTSAAQGTPPAAETGPGASPTLPTGEPAKTTTTTATAVPPPSPAPAVAPVTPPVVATPPPAPVAVAPVTSAADADADSEADAGTSASTERVSVMLRSTPPGAQVGTVHSDFGTTPVSVRFKPGSNYTIVFQRDGYKSVTKQLRVTEDADQELAVTLRRPPAAKPQAAAAASAPVPAAPAPTPEKPKPVKSTERTWYQRMFAR